MLQLKIVSYFAQFIDRLRPKAESGNVGERRLLANLVEKPGEVGWAKILSGSSDHRRRQSTISKWLDVRDRATSLPFDFFNKIQRCLRPCVSFLKLHASQSSQTYRLRASELSHRKSIFPFFIKYAPRANDAIASRHQPLNNPEPCDIRKCPACPEGAASMFSTTMSVYLNPLKIRPRPTIRTNSQHN
jgi:hypothetical protein